MDKSGEVSEKFAYNIWEQITAWNDDIRTNTDVSPPLIPSTMVSCSELELACEIASKGPFHFTFVDTSIGTKESMIAKIDSDSSNPSPTNDFSDDFLDISPIALPYMPSSSRRSLVTRTHSPKERENNSTHMNTTTVINSSDPVSDMNGAIETPTIKLLPLQCGGSSSSSNLLTKKRKFVNSNSDSSEDNDAEYELKLPNVFHSIQSTNSLESNTNMGALVNMISPTLRGITEAARILRRRIPSHGILSIPTEKFYTSICFVPFQRFNNDSLPSSPCAGDSISAWGTLQSLGSSAMAPLNPSVFLHHPIQAYNFVAFSTPKTFLFKQNSNSATTNHSEAPNDASMTAVTFSESHEILNRLSSAFWPGTVTIYAKARARKRRIQKMQGNGSVDSLSSLTSLSSDDLNVSSEEALLLPAIPILPPDLLYTPESLGIPQDSGNDGGNFIALRCPSHPIARSILELAYGQKPDIKTMPLKKAVVGISNHCHTKSAVVRNSFLSSANSNLNGSLVLEKPQVHVLNGEDGRELFSVPACQFSNLPSVSLVIDTPRRQIILHRDESHMKMNTSHNTLTPSQPPLSECKFDIKADDVVRALRQFKSQDNKCVKAKAIHAVISKWKVIEHQ